MKTISTLLSRALTRFVVPVVPPRLRLAFTYQMARWDDCEPELTCLHRLGPNRGTAVDAGANEGLFTYRLSSLYHRVHAFEINPALAHRLTRLVPHKASVYPFGLSSRDGDGTLYTPHYHGRALTGWGALETGNCPGAEFYSECHVSFRTLDSVDLDDVTFLNVDVEGHELHLLNGALRTIRQYRPVVLIEVRAQNRPAVQEYFRQLSYVERRLKDLTGKNGSSENYIYLPIST
jgi:FkbM family methyltransferase